MAVGFKKKKTTSFAEVIRRGLSKSGLSKKDKKDLAAYKKKQDAAIAKAKEDKKAAAKKRMMADAPAGKGGKAAKFLQTKSETVSDKQKQGQTKRPKKVGNFKRVLTKDPDAGRKQQGQITKKAAKVKDKSPMGKGTPKTVGAAQKAGSMFFFRKNKDGSQTKMLAVTAEQKKKLGMSLTAIANKYKGKDGMKRMLADLKKKKMAMGGAMMKKKGMAMGGSMKKKGMARGGMKKGYAMGGMKKKGMARGGMKKKGMAVGGAMKKKGMARGGMKKKGYAMGGLKATNPSQVGLRKLPQSVRNKMGYMKKGGMTKKGYAKGGSMKKKGYAMGGVAKKYGIVDNRKKKR